LRNYPAPTHAKAVLNIPTAVESNKSVVKLYSELGM
jgi:hypothetical protein